MYFIIVNLLAAGTVGTLLYICTSDAIKQLAIDANQNLLGQISKSTDTLLNQVDRYLDQITIDSDIMDLPKNMSEGDILSKISINNKIGSLLFTNNYIYDIAIYYVNEAKVFEVNNGFLDFKDYIYKDLLNSYLKHPPTIKAISAYQIIDKVYLKLSHNVIFVIKPIPINGGKSIVYALVIIEEGFFRDILNPISNRSGMEIYITNNEGNVISKNVEQGKYNGLINKNYLKSLSKEDLENRIDTYNNEKLFVSAVTSSTYGWKYISIIPYESVTGKVQIIRNYSIIVSLLAILLGIFASLYFSNKISRPINKIICLFNNESLMVISDKDIFKYIEKNVNSLLMNKENIEKTLTAHMPILQNNFLTGVLLGDITDKTEIEERFKYYGIGLKMDGNYIVYVISMGNYGELSRRYTEQQVNMLTIYLIGVISEMVNKENQGIVINTRPNELAIVLNLPIAINKVELKEEISKLEIEIGKSILGKTACSISMAVGGIYNEFNQLFLSYEEALEALEYGAFASGDKVMFYEDIKNIKEENYSYPSLKEDALLGFLRKCKLDEVLEQNKEIFKAIAGSNKAMVYYMKLLNSTISFIFEIGMNVGKELDENKLYNELLQCNNIVEVQVWFEQLFTRIAGFIENKKTSKNCSIIETVEKYIHENYKKDLSLMVLAGIVYMGTEHFRKIFKEETGISVKQYINSVRIEKAKNLLSDPKYKISQVAEAVGYDKMNAFLYFFKESTEMTPGEYRTLVLHIE